MKESKQDIIEKAICIYITKGKRACKDYIKKYHIKFETVYKLVYS